MNKQRPPWLEGLNSIQAKAVTHGEAPLLILAGAGSGKTRVITSRIAWMVAEKKFDASSILAVTFTNKAAREMRERVTSLVPDAHKVMIRTFHSFGAWILRRYASAAGLSPDFTIYDDNDQVSLLSQIVDGVSRRELHLWTHRIARAKDDGLSPNDDLSEFSHNPDFPSIYRLYEERLRSIGNVDFGDLIYLPNLLLRKNSEIRDRLRWRFQAILVDEYQDTNVAQYQLLKELTGPETWLSVVGDDDQSIYGFRGAEVGNILKFSHMFSGTEVMKLEQNYRSTKTILSIASAVVSHNAERLGKTLWTDGAIGEKAILAFLNDQESEAEWCADLINADGNLGGTAILYRTNAQSRIFETVFRRRDIPYQIVGTLSFYQREEVKDILACMAWLSNPRDEVAFRRIANKPSRGLGKSSLNKLITLAVEQFFGDILEACTQNILKGKAAKASIFLREMANRYRGGQTQEPQFENLGLMVKDLASFSGLITYYREVDRIENTRRIDNIDELVNAAADYPASQEGLTAFLEIVELDQVALEEENNDTNRVTLITIHNTKGLEFDRVIITGLEEDLFPRGDEGFDNDETEEERRLFYVAITRARQNLAFTSCHSRMIWGRHRISTPSRFLKELPEEFIKQEGQAGDARESTLWRPGTQIYHDEYGVGVVQKCLSNSGNTVIHVVFESGRRATLIPEFTAHKMEILGYVRSTDY